MQVHANWGTWSQLYRVKPHNQEPELGFSSNQDTVGKYSTFYLHVHYIPVYTVMLQYFACFTFANFATASKLANIRSQHFSNNHCGCGQLKGITSSKHSLEIDYGNAAWSMRRGEVTNLTIQTLSLLLVLCCFELQENRLWSYASRNTSAFNTTFHFWAPLPLVILREVAILVGGANNSLYISQK